MLFVLSAAAVGLLPGGLVARTAPAGASSLPRLGPAPLAALSDRPELPSDVLLRAVEGSGRVSAADVAAASGLDLLETRRQLLVLAQVVGADLQVSSDGELLFVFEPNVRGALRRESLRMRLRDGWKKASPAVLWLLRASFGVALLSSITIAVTGIALLSSSKSDGEGSRGASLPLSMWGPHPLDFFYYSRPYNAYDGEMGFLQSCFSLLFGDGDPNADLDLRQARAVAALVRSQGGAVTAEQLAPLLAPPLSPDEAEEEAATSTLVREGWVTEALVRFGGEPIVTEAGDIVYAFPELMVSADAAALPAGEPRGGGLVSLDRASKDVAAALAWDEAPAGWRPAVGERVAIAQLSDSRWRRQSELAQLRRWAGLEGVVVSDDRDGLPFKVSIPGGSTAYFSRKELRPTPDVPLTLQELPQRFSNAPPAQLAAAGALGAANLAAVAYLGMMLRTARSAGVTAAAAPTVAALGALYPPLLVYATGFVALPFARAAVLRRKNRGIEKRNRLRSAWGNAVASQRGQSLRRKLAAVKRFRPRRKVVRDEDVQFSAANVDGDDAEGMVSPMSDFDRRLQRRADGEEL